MALAGTTWTINSDVDFYMEYMNVSAFYSSSFTFSSNGNTYSSTSYTFGKPMGMKYDSTVVWAPDAWVDEVYRTIEIISVSSGEAGLETWLNANAVQVVPVDYLTTDVEITSIADAIRSKGGTSASLVYPAGFVSAIEAISTGTDVSDTTATASDVRTGKYFYNSSGVKTQGSIANGSATTPATTITANPTISVSNSGLITATASASQSVTPTVSAGYVSSGTAGTITVSGSNTSQLTTQAAQTIHPSTTDQTIASGKYLTGAQTVKGVLLTNLDAGNIKKDVVVKVGDSTDDDCVTTVTGTYEGGGGGGGYTDYVFTFPDITATGTYSNETLTSKGLIYTDFYDAVSSSPSSVVILNFTVQSYEYSIIMSSLYGSNYLAYAAYSYKTSAIVHGTISIGAERDKIYFGASDFVSGKTGATNITVTLRVFNVS